jgi:UDP-N-acetylmuramyl tripeptide synthase
MYLLTTLIAKLTAIVSKSFKRGAGYTLPGHYAAKIHPWLLRKIVALLPERIILITGTNGKTTTTKIITHVLEKNSYAVLCNKSGANLQNGIVSAVLLESDYLGRLAKDIAVFEVDELYFPVFLELLTKYRKAEMPFDITILFMNVSRDQLDRYFEPDIVLARWKSAIKKCKFDLKIVLDSTQAYFESFLSDSALATYGFDASYQALDRTKLTGEFNAKNLNAALLALELVGLSADESITALADFELAYGRGEELLYTEKSFKLYLAKNPASFNNNLKMVSSTAVASEALLFILNDNIPDGRDVSWIYDIDPVRLKNVCSAKEIYVAGTRFIEMALRLDYAGVDVKKANIDSKIKNVLAKISENSSVSKIVCFPNYSAMLALRKLLAGRSIL